MGQTYVEENKEMRFRMNWGCHLTPWPNHLRDWNRTEDEQKRISVHFNTYTQYHPGYLTLKENMVEDSVETGIKSPEPEGTKFAGNQNRTRLRWLLLRPHRNGRDTTRNDGYSILVLRRT
jgi:hypothetical protein